MKHYSENGHEFQTPPDPYKGRSPMHKPDGSYNDEAFRAMGGTITDDGSPWTETEKKFQALPCCTLFKTVCNQMAEFMGVDVFLGGYDDIPMFQQSEAAQENPVQALKFGMMWKAADDECNYRAQKFGIGRPRWWYCCWDIDPDNPEVTANGPVNAE